MELFGFESFVRPEILVATCILVAFYIISTIRNSKSKNLPPGPTGLPIVGSFFFLTKLPHLYFTKLASKYGDIFSLRLGSKTIIVLNDAEIIKKAFIKPEFLGRPPENPLQVIPGFESPFFSNGKAWSEQRRFTLYILRNLGFGKSKMEGHIKEEIECLLKVFKKNVGKQIRVRDFLTPSMSNNISSLVFGSRYDYDDPRRKFLDKTLDDITTILQQTSIQVFLPWVYKLPFVSTYFNYNELKNEAIKASAFIRDQIKSHKETLDPSNVRDYIDGYLIEMKERLEKDPETTFSENMLIGSALNFFGAGSETVRTTLDWCLYIMAAFPDVQKKIQSEIDNVIGQERMPTYLDNREMPFTQSVLMEIQRWQTVVPINVLRYTMDDVEFEGYNIPKGTIVLANFWQAHHDEKYWNNPTEFKPNRFLSDDGKTVKKSDYYMPFSNGKRSCPGEILAVIEIFLYFTSILQKFSVKLPEGEPVDFEGILTITYYKKPHKLILVSRN